MEEHREAGEQEATEGLELHYCQRCGVLGVGHPGLPFCGACTDLLRRLFQPQPEAPKRKKGDAKWTY